MAAPGALIADRYRLTRQLGAGGMGVVWEARDERLHRPVALKVLRIQPGSTEAETEVLVERAMREARISARLQHPYAVSVYDVVQHEGKPCIVMEMVPSVPLTEAMRQLGALTPMEVARLGSQVASALAAAHALGIVHRDVKPGNVLIGDDGAARICDFGISRALGDTTLTMTGMITGTPAYLAPEVARGEDSAYASDVYSLGATLYAAVEGEPPYGTEGNAIAVLYRVAAGEIKPPERSGQLGPLLLAMLRLQPEQRPSMADAAAALSAIAAGSDTPSPPPTTAEQPQPTVGLPSPQEPVTAIQLPATRPRSRTAIVLPVVAVLLAGMVAVALLWPGSPWSLTGSDPTSAQTPGAVGTTAPPRASGSPSENDSDAEPTPAELAQAVTAYYALLPDDTDAAWGLLTSSYQRQTGGRDSYDDFWNDIDTVTASAVSATAPDRAEATIAYVRKSGNQESTERRSFRLVRSDGVLKIDQSAVI